jgi:hypothetical protein
MRCQQFKKIQIKQKIKQVNHPKIRFEEESQRQTRKERLLSLNFPVLPSGEGEQRDYTYFEGYGQNEIHEEML